MKVKVLSLLGLDVFLLHLSYFLAFLLRFDGQIPMDYYQNYKEIMVVLIAIKVFTFFFFKLYKSLWRYASIEELLNICISVVLSNLVIIATIKLVHSSYLPRSIYLISTLLDLIFIGGVRFTYRALRRYKIKDILLKNTAKKNVLVVGGGSAGATVVKELRIHNELNLKVIGMIDDNTYKHGQRINGVKILGNRFQIAKIVEKYRVNEIIIAIPSAPQNTIREIVDECKSTKAKVKILPGVYELIDEKVTVNQIRPVKIEDLLGRETIQLDNHAIDEYIEGKSVLVTGGGGSIGSELCRQIAKYNPRELVILDIYENNAYELQNELNRTYNKLDSDKQLNLKVMIASVRDIDRVDQIVSTVRPNIIFHAAAHKHVPLMEDNPCEA
ncbi:MAG: polysaccharide biosynthesis protein, partial [Clostridia bacterium]|nr:polysaccharide biosynthesis protein [Clostridia bacterium]